MRVHLIFSLDFQENGLRSGYRFGTVQNPSELTMLLERMLASYRDETCG